MSLSNLEAHFLRFCVAAGYILCDLTFSCLSEYVDTRFRLDMSIAEQIACTPDTPRRWIWILGAGTIREGEPDPANNNRIRPLRAGLLAGKSVKPVKDKTK